MIVDNALGERKKLIWRGGSPAVSSRLVPEEGGVALTDGGPTYAVMMATPADPEDFGIGFSITEGIIQKADEIFSLDLVENGFGIEVSIWLNSDRSESLVARRRAIVGPVGCGLCGIESLERACLAPRQVNGHSKVWTRDLLTAMRTP